MRAVRTWCIGLAVLAAWLMSAGSAAAVSVSGVGSSSAPLVFDPSGDGGASTTTQNWSILSGVMVARMPQTRMVRKVTLGNLAAGSGCSTAPTYNLYIHDAASGSQLAYSPVAQALPLGTPGRVTWDVQPTLLLAGHEYRFEISGDILHGCADYARTTWKHDNSVDGGSVLCANDAPTFNGPRVWHAIGESDNPGCLTSGFDPSLPTGWLETYNSHAQTAYSSDPSLYPFSLASACGSDHAGLAMADWAATPHYQVACVWTHYAPSGSHPSDGWAYSIPWESARDFAPAAMYLKIDGSDPTASDEAGCLPCSFHRWGNLLGAVFNADPVNSVTGNFSETVSDVSVAGKGVGLGMSRTYNSAFGVTSGPFGPGWAATWRDILDVSQASDGLVLLHNAYSSTIEFSRTASGDWVAPSWSQAELASVSGGGYDCTLPDQTVMRFSSAGKLQSVTDRNGNQTTLSYTSGRLTSVTDPASRSLDFDYNTDGTVSSVTDPAGGSVTYGYTSGKLTSVTDLDGKTTTYGYSGNDLTTITDPRGHTMTNGYDSQHRVTSQQDRRGKTSTWSYSSDHVDFTNPDGDVTRTVFEHLQPTSITTGYGTTDASTTTIAYDDLQREHEVTDANGHTWTYDRNNKGDVTAVTDPLDRATSTTWVDHRPTSVTLPSGKQTSISYDSNGNPAEVEKTDGTTTLTWTTDYDGDGLLQSSTDPLDHTWTYGYNTRGDRTSATSPLGHETSFSYDDDSRVTSATSARGNASGATPSDFTTTYDLDDLGLLQTLTDPRGHDTSYGYDDNHDVTDVTDADGNVTHTVYNYDDQPTSVTSGYGTSDAATTSTAYTDAGLIASQTDGNGKTTTYTHDHRGQVESVTDPLSRETTYDYDDAGNLTAATDAASRTETLTYDDANELATRTPSTGPATSYAYNDDGQLHTATRGSAVSTLTYDGFGRLASSTNPAGQETGYGYDDAGRLSSIAYPDVLLPLDTSTSATQASQDAGTITYGYDDDDRMTSVTDWLDTTTSFAYDPDNELTSTSRPGVDATTYTYNRSGAMTAFAQPGIDQGDPTLTTSYGRSDADRLSNSADSYDALGRLTGHSGASYGYDDADNLTTTIAPGTSTAVAQVFDDAHQLTASTPSGGTATHYGYDDVGDRLTETLGSASTPAVTYGYDTENRLTSYTGTDHANPTGPAFDAAYTYDPLGQRATVQDGDILRHETYNLTAGLPLMIEDGGTSYIYGPGGTPVEHITAAGDQVFYTHDQLGSTTRLTDPDGHTQATYNYDAYGNTSASIGGHSYTNGSGTHTIPAADTSFRYAGQNSDVHTGLQYLRARYYQSASGQFLTRDPIENLTGQPYSYADDDPINLDDPSGLCSLGFFCDIPGALGDAGMAVSNADAAALNFFTGGGSTAIAGAALGFDPDQADFGAAGDVGQAIAFGVGFFDGESEFLCIEGAAKEAPAIVRGGETAAARYGREIHKSFDYGPGFEREFRLPSGRRADAVNFETREIVELKPNNPRAIAQGQRQLDRYAEEFNREFPGDPFTTRLHTYDRP